MNDNLIPHHTHIHITLEITSNKLFCDNIFNVHLIIVGSYRTDLINKRVWNDAYCTDDVPFQLTLFIYYYRIEMKLSNNYAVYCLGWLSIVEFRNYITKEVISVSVISVWTLLKFLQNLEWKMWWLIPRAFQTGSQNNVF